MYSTLDIKKKPNYNAADAYDTAMQQLQTVKSKLPAYDDRYEQSLRELYGQITQRPKFSYDPNGDALYQGYKQSYAQQGRLAMEDAMGQAAGLTGGYGSSYAQSVGQQQYGAYLQKLGDVYPQLYGMAYQQYLDEGSALQKQYDLLAGQSDAEYGRYQDRLEAYYQELGYWQDRADTAYDRGAAEEKTAYDRGRDAYDRLAEMIMTMGYTPDGEELRAAGMSDRQLQAYLGYYQSLNAVSGGSGSKEKDEETSPYDTAMAYAEKRLKKTDVETVNGEIAQKVARGELDAETARQVIAALTERAYG